MNRNSKRRTFILWVGLLVVLIWSLFPIIMTILTSFKKPNIAFKIPPVWIFRPVLDNYINVFLRTEFPKYFLNSIIIASSTTLLSLSLGSLAAYSFARFDFYGKNTILFAFLVTRMIPPIVLAIPLFLIGRTLHLNDTRFLLICAHTALNIPFVIWMMHDFIRMIPYEIEEAAMIDGCRRIKALFYVVLPLTGPGLVATSIFCVLLSWNDFIFALMLTGRHAKPLSVAITMFTTTEGIEWGNISAAASTIMLPVLIFAIVVRNHMVRGLTMGTLKE